MRKEVMARTQPAREAISAEIKDRADSGEPTRAMFPRIPSNVSRKIVGGALFVATGLGGAFIYQRAVLGNPMRLGFDEEGVWSLISRWDLAAAAPLRRSVGSRSDIITRIDQMDLHV